AWRLTRPRVPALLGLALLTALVLIAPLPPLIMLLGTMVTSLESLVGGMVLLLVLYLPYVVFLHVKLALAAPALVLERRGVVDAMRRSWRLVAGDFWRVFGILFLAYLITQLVGFVLSLPFTFAAVLITILGEAGTAAMLLAAIAIVAGTTVASMITYPFQAGVYGLLYTDRRMRAEAFDLVLQTAAVGNQNLGWVPATVDDLWHPAHAAGTPPAAPPPPPSAPPAPPPAPPGPSSGTRCWSPWATAGAGCWRWSRTWAAPTTTWRRPPSASRSTWPTRCAASPW
ncbi:MAG TPA: glycerophosphoryl diester phosphodiesterase membrane domain-containing protein, partial [Acidimicrobiales bacterium]